MTIFVGLDYHLYTIHYERVESKAEKVCSINSFASFTILSNLHLCRQRRRSISQIHDTCAVGLDSELYCFGLSCKKNQEIVACILPVTITKVIKQEHLENPVCVDPARQVEVDP